MQPMKCVVLKAFKCHYVHKDALKAARVVTCTVSIDENKRNSPTDKTSLFKRDVFFLHRAVCCGFWPLLQWGDTYMVEHNHWPLNVNPVSTHLFVDQTCSIMLLHVYSLFVLLFCILFPEWLIYSVFFIFSVTFTSLLNCPYFVQEVEGTLHIWENPKLCPSYKVQTNSAQIPSV